MDVRVKKSSQGVDLGKSSQGNIKCLQIGKIDIGGEESLLKNFKVFHVRLILTAMSTLA